MKNFFKKHRKEIICTVIFAAAILFACIYHFGLPSEKDAADDAAVDNISAFADTATKKNTGADNGSEKEENAEITEDEKPDCEKENASGSAAEHDTEKSDNEFTSKEDNKNTETAEKENVNTDKPDEEVHAVAEAKNTCSLAVNCSTILNNIGKLKAGKEKLVPEGGIILSLDKAEFEEGETAFDVLLRELGKKNISIKYTNPQISTGCYIESIGGIGEFDCGSTSGWLYKVNGETVNVASSKYVLKKGDRVEFLYTCKMGDI